MDVVLANPISRVDFFPHYIPVECPDLCLHSLSLFTLSLSLDTPSQLTVAYADFCFGLVGLLKLYQLVFSYLEQ